MSSFLHHLCSSEDRLSVCEGFNCHAKGDNTPHLQEVKKNLKGDKALDGTSLHKDAIVQAIRGVLMGRVISQSA